MTGGLAGRRDTPARQERYRAAGGVVWDEGRVLVLDRPGRGEVRLPKGHIRADEAPRQAALREAQEETGYADLRIAADLGAMRVEFRFEGRDVVRDESYFAVLLGSDRRVDRPAKDADQFRPRWLPAAEAVAQLTFEAEKEWVRRAMRWDASRAEHGEQRR